METSETNSPEAVETSEPQVEATVLDGDEGVSETTYVDGKFKSVSALEDSYKELQSTFSKKLGAFEGAPTDGYTFEGEVGESDKATFDMLQAWGSENSLSQSGLEGLVGQYNELQSNQRAAGIDQAYKDLGENADRRLSNAKDFLVANLGEEATQSLAANMNTAASIEAVEKLIAMTKAPKAAPTQAATVVDAAKLESLRYATNDNGDRLMSVDPSYRKMVMEAEARAKGAKVGYVVNR